MGKFATLLAGLILIGVFGIILLGVSARFTGMRFAWTEELARWGLVSLTYVGASAALRNKQHAGVNVVLNLLPNKAGKIVAALAYLILAFVVVFLCLNSFEAGDQGFPYSWGYTSALHDVCETADPGKFLHDVLPPDLGAVRSHVE